MRDTVQNWERIANKVKYDCKPESPNVLFKQPSKFSHEEICCGDPSVNSYYATLISNYNSTLIIRNSNFGLS